MAGLDSRESDRFPRTDLRLGQSATHRLAIGTGLLAIYVLWGSTYPAIRVGVQTIPPFLMASIRYVLAGGLLLAWAIARGERRGRPSARELRAAIVIGGTMALIGNGGVAWAEQRLPAGIVALILGSVPLWMALADKLLYRQRLGRIEVVGLSLGFVGLLFLIGPSLTEGGVRAEILVALLSAVAWAAGSLYSRSAVQPGRPLLGTSMWMIAGGGLLGFASLLQGEPAALDIEQVTAASWAALGYLIVFGTLVGFTTYTWLLRVARTSLVSTYAYMNPVVAVFLGWAILGERIGLDTLIAGFGVIVAVAIIIGSQRRPPPSEPR